jgi:hypothetical protein
VALAVKQGSQVSDMRHHTFSGRLRGAQVVYFRANSAGACNYFNDSRCGLQCCEREGGQEAWACRQGVRTRRPPACSLVAFAATNVSQKHFETWSEETFGRGGV